MASTSSTTSDHKTKTNGHYKDQMKDHMDSNLRGASEIAKDLGVGEKVAEGIDEKVETLKKTLSTMNTDLREFGRKSEEYLKEHPYRAVIAGAVCGFILSRFMGRKG